MLRMLSNVGVITLMRGEPITGRSSGVVVLGDSEVMTDQDLSECCLIEAVGTLPSGSSTYHAYVTK